MTVEEQIEKDKEDIRELLPSIRSDLERARRLRDDLERQGYGQLEPLNETVRHWELGERKLLDLIDLLDSLQQSN